MAVILKTPVDRSSPSAIIMNTDSSAFVRDHRQAEFATHPLAHLAARLPLSLVVAGPGLPPPRFAAGTRPDAPSATSNCGF
jgi:hypothetical protein